MLGPDPAAVGDDVHADFSERLLHLTTDRLGLRQIEPGQAVVGHLDLKPLKGKFIAIDVRNDLVVFDYEDFFHAQVFETTSAWRAR